MDATEAARMLEENPTAVAVHDSAIGPVLIMPAVQLSELWRPKPRRQQPRPPVPFATLATIAWMRGVVDFPGIGAYRCPSP